MFDTRTPACDVRVLPVSPPRVHGLTPAQSQGRRRLDNAYSVLGYRPQVQCVKTSGGGLPPSMVKPSGDTRSDNHRRRSPKRRAQNPCCVKHIPTYSQYAARDVRDKLAALTELHRTIMNSPVALPKREADYERMRGSFRRLHREHFQAVLGMERGVVARAA